MNILARVITTPRLALIGMAISILVATLLPTSPVFVRYTLGVIALFVILVIVLLVLWEVLDFKSRIVKYHRDLLKDLLYEVPREYRYKDGELYKEETRVVAPRAVTQQIIFEKVLYQGASKIDLKQVGRSVGDNFASGDFLEKLKRKEEVNRNDIDAVLAAWSVFDGRAGWGVIEISSAEDLSKGVGGNISVRNNFLIYRRKREDLKLCTFLEGYLEGVVSQLLKHQVIVTESLCGMGMTEETCHFRVEFNSLSGAYNPFFNMNPLTLSRMNLPSTQ